MSEDWNPLEQECQARPVAVYRNGVFDCIHIEPPFYPSDRQPFRPGWLVLDGIPPMTYDPDAVPEWPRPREVFPKKLRDGTWKVDI